MVIFVIIIKAVLFLGTKELAGYRYINFTATQVKIIPFEVDWEERIIVKEKRVIKSIIDLIDSSSLDSNAEVQCEIGNLNKENSYSIIIRRNLSINDMSWIACTENNDTYLVPLLHGGSLLEEYKLDNVLLIEEINRMLENKAIKLLE